MTLSAVVSRVNYPGADSVGPFTIPFRFQAAADLLVTKRTTAGAESTLALTTGYTVTGAGNATGALTLTTALATGEVLSIRRAPALTQDASIRNQGTYFPATIEDELDRLTMQLQALRDELSRAPRVHESYDPADLTLTMRGETGKVLAWQSDTELGNSILDSSAVALPGNGRQVATLSAYLANNAVFNVLDYYAVADGTDYAIAVNRAIAAATATGGVILFPPKAGGYRFLTPVDVTVGSAKGLLFTSTGPQSVDNATIDVRHTGHGFDMIGAGDVTFRDLTVTSDVSNALPKTIFFLGRESSGSSAGRHRFYNVKVNAYARYAILYSYGSEENELHGCWFSNLMFGSSANVRCIVSTGYNVDGLTSTLRTIATGARSNLGLNIYGGSFSVNHGPTADVFYLDSAVSVNIYGAWAFAGGSSLPGRSIVYVDPTNTASDLVRLHGMHIETAAAGQHQKYFVMFGTGAARTHAGWSVQDCRIDCGDTTRTGVTVGTTNLSTALTSAGQFTDADQGALVVGTGIPFGTRILSVTNANLAVMSLAAAATGSPVVVIRYRSILAASDQTLDGFRLQNNSEVNVRGFHFAGNIQKSHVMSPDSLLQIDGTSTRNVLIGSSSNWSVGARDNDIWLDLADGSVDIYTALKRRGIQIAAARRTGWTDQTAVAARTDLGAAPTVGALASAFRALYDDLKAHGLIGA